MKLYRFYLSTWKSVEVSREVLEVEEKPKTYIIRGDICDTRISKSEVGVVSGYSNNRLYMLEDDMEKAKAIFVESLKGKIESEKREIENTIKRCNGRIAEYENSIAELLKG